MLMCHRRSLRTKTQGFTLIEMLMVVALLALVAGATAHLAVGMLQSDPLQQAQRHLQQQLHIITQACRQHGAQTLRLSASGWQWYQNADLPELRPYRGPVRWSFTTLDGDTMARWVIDEHGEAADWYVTARYQGSKQRWRISGLHYAWYEVDE